MPWRTLRGAWCTSSPPTPPPRQASKLASWLTVSSNAPYAYQCQKFSVFGWAEANTSQQAPERRPRLSQAHPCLQQDPANPQPDRQRSGLITGGPTSGQVQHYKQRQHCQGSTGKREERVLEEWGTGIHWLDVCLSWLGIVTTTTPCPRQGQGPPTNRLLAR